MTTLQVDLPWEVEEGVEVELRVVVEYDAGGGNRCGHPDTWTEAWTELEIVDIQNQHGCSLPPPVCGRVRASNAFMRAVQEEVEKQVRP